MPCLGFGPARHIPAPLFSQTRKLIIQGKIFRYYNILRAAAAVTARGAGHCSAGADEAPGLQRPGYLELCKRPEGPHGANVLFHLLRRMLMPYFFHGLFHLHASRTAEKQRAVFLAITRKHR